MRVVSPERQRQELEFYSPVGAVYVVNCSTAAEMCLAHAGHKSRGSRWAPSSELLRVPSGQARALAVRGEVDQAQRFDEICWV